MFSLCGTLLKIDYEIFRLTDMISKVGLIKYHIKNWKLAALKPRLKGLNLGLTAG